MSASDLILEVDGVSKRFCRDLKRSLWYGIKDIAGDCLGQSTATETLRPSEFWALHDVSLTLRRGECLGLIGSNGAGKTTLLRLISGLIKPDGGAIRRRGRMGALIALGAGFNPVLTGRENIYVNAAILGLSKRETDAKLDEIIAFADIGDALEAPVQSYSSGMTVRLGFAIAAHLEPDLLIIDEVLAVGDISFREKCLSRVTSVLDHTAVVFVSHNHAEVQRVCNRACYLEQGRVRRLGSTDEILREYTRSQCRESSSNGETPLRVPAQLKAGDDLEISLAADPPCAAVEATRFTINVLAAGHTIAAQAEMTTFAGGSPSFPMQFNLQNLFLAEGHYDLEVLFWRDRTFLGKVSLANRFFVEGHPKMWGYYQPRAKLVLPQVNSDA